MKKLYIVACHVLWRELCSFASRSPHVCQFHFLQQGLHNTPDLLRTQVQAAVDRVGDGYDALLLGYGLCSNGLAGITARQTPLIAVRGHDCITFLLGSKERYRAYFDAHPGTYWYSPGWIETCLMPGPERHEKMDKEYRERYGADNAAYLLEMEEAWTKNYSRAAYVDLGCGPLSAARDYTRACAAWLKWQYEELAGDPRLVQALVNGDWNSDDFLVVPPGRTIKATNDERIFDLE
jgi:hypothetical protein